MLHVYNTLSMVIVWISLNAATTYVLLKKSWITITEVEATHIFDVGPPATGAFLVEEPSPPPWPEWPERLDRLVLIQTHLPLHVWVLLCSHGYPLDMHALHLLLYIHQERLRPCQCMPFYVSTHSHAHAYGRTHRWTTANQDLGLGPS